ncbi:hypothetical protein B0H11DRAFT_1926413 [Mycena galericulata]|nr:hypothetical protein B0H11DRAFT_1926413 [Mycena galericulata]
MSSSSSELAPDREAHENIIKTILYHELLEKHLVPPKELGIPLKQLYPGDWNWHFEQVYRRKYGPDADPEAWRAENFDYFDLEMLSYVRNLGLCNQEIARTSKILLREEGMLVGMAIEELVDGNFEATWTALEIEAKREFVLDGLVRGAFQAREKSRFDCPEMSLFGLSGDGEYKLVNLLKVIVAHDPTGNLRVKSLYLFSHPAVEREYGYASKAQVPDKMRAFGYLRIIQRNLYIVQTLIGILEAYAGKPAPEISIKAEAEAKQRQACYSCGAASTEDGVALRRCSGCKLVVYCSSQCQECDWHDHKKLCGKRSTRFDPAVVTPAPEVPVDFIGCPAPDAGFVRSPALWRQIWYLSKKDSYERDYHFDIAPGRTRSIRIPHSVLRIVFLVARRRAMASGDPGAVRKMHDVLSRLQREGFVDLTPAQIRGQLEREYRMVISSGGYGARPTSREMLQELAYMGQRYELAEMEAQGVTGDVAQEEREYDHEDVKDEWENISKEDSGSEGDVDDEELYEVQA